MEAQGKNDGYTESSCIMDSGDCCRVCFGWRQHLTSAYPSLQGKARFVEAFNMNLNNFFCNNRYTQGYWGRNGRYRGGGINNRAKELESLIEKKRPFRTSPTTTRRQKTCLRFVPPPLMDRSVNTVKLRGHLRRAQYVHLN